MMIFEHFTHLNLSNDQSEALMALDAFFYNDKRCFIIYGYAGSGKTTIIGGVTNYLEQIGKDFRLFAPTGRAAKVLGTKTEKSASTIHRGIYQFDRDEDLPGNNENVLQSTVKYFKLKENDQIHNQVFIVDESSMISDTKSEDGIINFGSGCLLTDLLIFAKIQNPNANTKIVFVGDPCQLPPVGDINSNALNPEYLKEKFSIEAKTAEIREVVRQTGQNTILKAASKIRKSITSGYFNDFSFRNCEPDINSITEMDFLEIYQKIDETKIVIAYKNETCDKYNRIIREARYGQTSPEPQLNDIVIFDANNYLFGALNGDFAVISEVGSLDTREIPIQGSTIKLNFRSVKLILVDSLEGSTKEIDGFILENYLTAKKDFKNELRQALVIDFEKRNSGLKRNSDDYNRYISQDKYVNSFMVKYGYAITGHKSQGGEWETVFCIWDYDNSLQQIGASSGKSNPAFYRWAYTVITRSAKKIFNVNAPYFNSYSKIQLIQPGLSKTIQQIIKKANSTVVELTEEYHKVISDLGFSTYPFEFHNHIIKIYLVASNNGYELKNYEVINQYEIRITISDGTKSIIFKTSVNTKNEFNKKVMIMKSSFDKPLAENLLELIINAPDVTIKQSSQTQDSKILPTFDLRLEESYPFTRYLFDDILNILAPTLINLKEVEHFSFRERYHFEKMGLTAIIDFGYDGKGFWGRVEAHKGDDNLVNELFSLLGTLKN